MELLVQVIVAAVGVAIVSGIRTNVRHPETLTVARHEPG